MRQTKREYLIGKTFSDKFFELQGTVMSGKVLICGSGGGIGLAVASSPAHKGDGLNLAAATSGSQRQ